MNVIIAKDFLMTDKDYNRYKVNRTKGYKSQKEYDIEISDFDMSSLRFLKFKYKKDLLDFHNHFDLNDPECYNEYTRLQQRYKMINEELHHRSLDIYASPSYQDRGEYLDTDTSLLIDKYGEIICEVSYDEDYNHIMYDGEEVQSLREDFIEDKEDDYIMYTSPERKDIYRDWNYYEEI